MKAWITKYALSEGILCEEVEQVSDSMIKADGMFRYFHGEGRDWHKTPESAIARAEEMRKKKIASIKKQLQKLENLKFSCQ